MSSSVLSVSSSKSHDLADLGTRESLESILSFKQFIGQDQSISEWDKALFGSAKNDGSKEMIEIAQWDGSAQCTAIHSAPKSLPKSAQVDTILSSTGVLSIDRPFTSSSDTRITSYRPKASPVRHQLKSAQLSEANVKPKELTFFNSETVHKIPPVMYTEEPGPSEVRIQEV